MNGNKKVKVVFLVEDTGSVMAYFPEWEWSVGNNTAFSMTDGHSPCSDMYAMTECHSAHKRNERAAVKVLRECLKSMAYDLEVLDADRWLNGRKAA